MRRLVPLHDGQSDLFNRIRRVTGDRLDECGSDALPTHIGADIRAPKEAFVGLLWIGARREFRRANDLFAGVRTEYDRILAEMRNMPVVTVA